VVPRAVLDAVEKRKILPWWESNPNLPLTLWFMYLTPDYWLEVGVYLEGPAPGQLSYPEDGGGMFL
jgi:hypothetical protein